MKVLALTLILTPVLFSACDVQSGITKKSMEKYETTPTPEKTVEAVEQVDSADVLNVEPQEEGPNILVNSRFNKPTVDCNKFNRVSLNGNAWELKITGVCQRVVINGDRNKVVANAFSEVMLNGSDNEVQFSKYVNGKKPLIMDNGDGNSVEKGTSPQPVK